MFGVMNIHCGNVFALSWSLNVVSGFIFASLSCFCATESYSTAGLCLRTYMFAPVLGLSYSLPWNPTEGMSSWYSPQLMPLSSSKSTSVDTLLGMLIMSS
jgi:hypothetical protein